MQNRRKRRELANSNLPLFTPFYISSSNSMDNFPTRKTCNILSYIYKVECVSAFLLVSCPIITPIITPKTTCFNEDISQTTSHPNTPARRRFYCAFSIIEPCALFLKACCKVRCSVSYGRIRTHWT